MEKIEKIKGTRDFYPNEMATQRALYDVMDRVMSSFGYREYDAPMLEKFELYAAKSSQEIIEEQSYVFEDRGGRKLVLRPEMTPSVARLVANQQRELPAVLRWYTIANCWRYEKPQKGRLRNFFQLNWDLFGSDSPEADAEIIELPLKLLEELGADMTKIGVLVNDRTLLNNLLEGQSIDAEKSKKLISLIDRKAKLELSEWQERMKEVGIDDSQLAAIETFLALDASTLPDGPEYDRLRRIIEIFTEKGYGDIIVFDPTVVRGFDYYTSTAFEIFNNSGDFRRSVCGGGRYDNLIEQFGGNPQQAVGCAASAIAIQELFRAQGREMKLELPDRYMVVPYSANEASEAANIANKLRADGKQVAIALPPYDMKKSMKLADKSSIDFIIMVKPDELAQGQVIMKDLKSGNEEKIEIENL